MRVFQATGLAVQPRRNSNQAFRSAVRLGLPDGGDTVKFGAMSRGVKWGATLVTLLGLGGFAGVTYVKSLQKPTEKEMAAFQLMHYLLEPNKLGGEEDRTFNQNDFEPIIEELVANDPHIRTEINKGVFGQETAPAEMTLRDGIGLRIANKAARNKVTHDLEESFQVRGILPKNDVPSETPRKITLAEIHQFTEALKELDNYSERMLKTFGRTYDLPHGVSQADLEAIMNCQIPPNGVLRTAP